MKLLPLDDPRWTGYCGGYKHAPYNVVPLIEELLAQPENNNPPIPTELELSYAMALRQLPVLGTERMRRGCTETLMRGIAATAALAAGHRVLARAYLEFGRSDALSYLHDLNGFRPGPHDT